VQDYKPRPVLLVITVSSWVLIGVRIAKPIYDRLIGKNKKEKDKTA
jgi:hypothetical protein